MESGRHTEVAIVGGGPCGLMLAIELGRRGIAATLFDDKPGTTTHPQANATQARTMEHFRRLGFADQVRGAGLPPDYPTDIAYFTRYTGYELARFKLPSARQATSMIRSLGDDWSAAELPHRVSQMYVEKILYAQAVAQPTVRLAYGWRVSEIEDTGDTVRLAVEAIDGSNCIGLTANWLVGCDGARSTVRRHLGFAYQGESGARRDFMGGQMHAVYFRAPQLYELIAGPAAWMYWTFNPDRRAFMAAINGRDEFVFHTQLREGEAAGAIGDEQARNMFAAALGVDCGIEIISRSSWTAGYTLVADRFRCGRIFLAGDAAHLFTPTGGLGYNTAVEDAVNLGWKLAACLRGWGSDRLLASFEAERRPAALRNTGYAREFADSIGLYAADPRIEEDSPEGARTRAEAGAYLEAHARAEFNIPGITFGMRYDDSPAICADGASPPPDAANRYVASACPGGRPPHLWLDDGGSLYDTFGRDFTLLHMGGGRETAETFAAAAATRAIPLAVVDLTATATRDLYEADFALIRPDQVVAWRGGKDVRPDEVLGRVSGCG